MAGAEAAGSTIWNRRARYARSIYEGHDASSALSARDGAAGGCAPSPGGPRR